MIIICPHCKKKADIKAGYVNRAKKLGVPRYCSKACSGLARKIERTDEEKKRLKAEYDKKHRKIFAEDIKKAKAAAFKKDYKENPEKYRAIRRRRKDEHNEYCRRPEYKKWKAEYDQKHRAKKNYGEFAECHLLIREIEKEYDQREILQINNLHNKTQKRKRKWKQQLSKNCLPRT